MAERTLNYSLFKKSDGTPIMFFMRPCNEKQTLRPIIEKYGGNLTSKAFQDCIRLAEKGSLVSTDGYIATKFIHESVEQNKLADMEQFKIPPGTRAVSDVDEELSIKSFSSDDSMAPASYICEPSAKPIKGRTKYTREDDVAIINYLIEKNRYHEQMGMRVYKDMEISKVTHHSAGSMNTRYRKVIFPNIDQYQDVVDRKWLFHLKGSPVKHKEPEYSCEVLFQPQKKHRKDSACTMPEKPRNVLDAAKNVCGDKHKHLLNRNVGSYNYQTLHVSKEVNVSNKNVVSLLITQHKKTGVDKEKVNDTFDGKSKKNETCEDYSKDMETCNINIDNGINKTLEGGDSTSMECVFSVNSEQVQDCLHMDAEQDKCVQHWTETSSKKEIEVYGILLEKIGQCTSKTDLKDTKMRHCKSKDIMQDTEIDSAIHLDKKRADADENVTNNITICNDSILEVLQDSEDCVLESNNNSEIEKNGERKTEHGVEDVSLKKRVTENNHIEDKINNSITQNTDGNMNEKSCNNDVQDKPPCENKKNNNCDIDHHTLFMPNKETVNPVVCYQDNNHDSLNGRADNTGYDSMFSHIEIVTISDAVISDDNLDSFDKMLVKLAKNCGEKHPDHIHVPTEQVSGKKVDVPSEHHLNVSSAQSDIPAEQTDVSGKHVTRKHNIAVLSEQVEIPAEQVGIVFEHTDVLCEHVNVVSQSEQYSSCAKDCVLKDAVAKTDSIVEDREEHSGETTKTVVQLDVIEDSFDDVANCLKDKAQNSLNFRKNTKSVKKTSQKEIPSQPKHSSRLHDESVYRFQSRDEANKELVECVNVSRKLSKQFGITQKFVHQLLYQCSGDIKRTMIYINYGPHSPGLPPWTADDDKLLMNNPQSRYLVDKFGKTDMKDRLTFLQL